MSLRKKIMSVALASVVASSALAMSALSVSAATVSEKESNNTMETANAVTLGNTVKGSLAESDRADFYRVVLSSSGCLTVDLSAYMEYIDFLVYDADGNNIYGNHPYWNSNSQKITAKYSFDLTKGTYYISASVYANRYGDYELKTAFESAGESFTETGSGTNNNMVKASGIKLSTEYKGQLAMNDSADFYKLTLPSSGCLKVNITAYMEYVSFNVYDEEGNEVYSHAPYWTATMETIVANYDLELTKGTYYIAVSKYGNRYGNYTLKASLTSANESFAESGYGTNNSMKKASNIKLDTEYRGQIAINDNNDFYKISLNSSGCMVFDLTAYIEYINFKVYNSNGEEIYSNSPNWNGTTGKISSNYYLDLTKGDYYISLSKYSNRCGSYYFKVSFIDSKESFIESGWGTNNNMESANRIELGKRYSGQIAWDDNKDFYKLNVSSGGTYKFVVSSNVEYMYMEIYDSDAKCLIRNDTSSRRNNDTIYKEYDVNLGVGEYYVAFTRNGNHFGTYNFYLAAPGATITDATGSDLKNNSLISATEINLGSTFTVVGASTGGTKCYQYAFFYKKTTDKTWTVKQNFSSNPSVSIKPAKAVKYNVCVKIRDEMGKEAKKYFTVNVSPKVVNTSTLSASSVKLGSSVSANCSATGGSTFYKYAFYYKKKADTKWVTLQGFKESSKITFKPDVAGDYDICVKVIDSRTSSTYAVKKYFTLKVTK